MRSGVIAKPPCKCLLQSPERSLQHALLLGRQITARPRLDGAELQDERLRQFTIEGGPGGRVRMPSHRMQSLLLIHHDKLHEMLRGGAGFGHLENFCHREVRRYAGVRRRSRAIYRVALLLDPVKRGFRAQKKRFAGDRGRRHEPILEFVFGEHLEVARRRPARLLCLPRCRRRCGPPRKSGTTKTCPGCARARCPRPFWHRGSSRCRNRPRYKSGH